MSLGLRHLRRRKKPRKADFPDRSFVLKEALDILIYPIAILAPFALLPQVYKIYATHDAGGLALTSWLFLGAINLAWLLYAHVHKEVPIFISNAAFAVLNFAVAIGVVLYG